jgi:hypothetical protein
MAIVHPATFAIQTNPTGVNGNSLLRRMSFTTIARSHPGSPRLARQPRQPYGAKLTGKPAIQLNRMKNA